MADSIMNLSAEGGGGGEGNTSASSSYTISHTVNGSTTLRLDPGKVMGVHIWPAAHGLATNVVGILVECGAEKGEEDGCASCLEVGAGAALPSLVVSVCVLSLIHI